MYRERGNRAVAFALREARQRAAAGELTPFFKGYALGQLLVARCDLGADRYILEGAENEIFYLSARSEA